ncbi:hypothetical protein VTN77DRAFT_3657 [Rasamsonia byssochlamydoides]|uniref:uncharacterized protein n=1 Tax=Rasamsonia byssochlamydoides TaxID=89139 RepID=UPI003742E49E
MDTPSHHLSSHSSSYISIALLAGLLLIPVVTLTSPQLRKWQSNLSLLQFGKKNNVTEVTALRVYPIKSCRGFQVPRTTLQLHGLDLDRRWMFVDAKTREFLTIRQIPQMTLINTGLSEDGQSLLVRVSDGVDGQDKKVISIPAHPTDEWLAANTTLATVKIWDIETDGYLYGPEVNDPFSTFLQQDVCLVYKGPTPRVLRGNGDPRVLGRTQSTFFPDVHPVLIGSEASLAELNARLAKKGVDPITIERFRPNIIVRGNVPWAEDTWKLVRFSQKNEKRKQTQTQKPLDVDIVARCTRCQVPNVEPSTAQKHPSEPWDTLMSYRRVDEGMKYKPCFGMLGAPRNEGEIEVGMKVEVLAETSLHRYVKGF